MANAAAIPPMSEARSSGAIMRGLAEKMGLDHPALQESDEAIAASALPEGWSLDGLMREGWRKSSPPRPAIAPWVKKLRLADGPVLAPERPGTLQLLSPKSHYFLNSTFANMPRHQSSQGEPAITLNVMDAAMAGAGDLGWRASGEAQGQRCGASRRGHPRGQVVGAGAAQAAMNLLTPSRWSPAGQPAYNEVFVTVEAV